MNIITESQIEEFAKELLEKQDYRYVYAPDDGMLERDSYEPVVLLLDRLRKVRRINLDILADQQEEAIREIQSIASLELIANNESFHCYMTEGVPVSSQRERKECGDLVWLVAFEKSVTNYFEKILSNTKQIQTLTKLRDTLLPKLMACEIKIDYFCN